MAPYHYRRYGYDETDRLLERSSDVASPETYLYDPASNLLERGETTLFWRHNRVLQHEGITYRYDIHRRTAEKRRNGCSETSARE